MSRGKAYVTFVTNDQFAIGAFVLLCSINKVTPQENAAIKLVMVTEQVSTVARRKLTKTGAEIREIDSVIHRSAEIQTHLDVWKEVGYTKLLIWGLTEFSQVLYIDSDCLVMNDVSELFDRDVDFAAAPDICPPDRFNAGVMLLKPNMDVLADLLSKINQLPSYEGGDTGFLNAYFSNWFELPSDHRLQFRYNAQRILYSMTYKKNPGYWRSLEPIKIIHFSSYPKPWEDPSKKGDLEFLWWQAYITFQSGIL